MQLIIDTARTRISVRNKAFFVQKGNAERIIGLDRIDSIAIYTHCQINASAIQLAAKNQIPIYFYNRIGKLQARICSPYLTNMANLRRKQLYFYHHKEAANWILDSLQNKTYIQLQLLINNTTASNKELIEKSTMLINQQLSKTLTYRNKSIDTFRKTLLGIEGSINRAYFKSLAQIVPEQYHFDRRSRRPAMDYFNAGLNYLYGMTYSIVENGIYAKGLDPYSGFMHTDNYRKPSLVFDMIEPVRPLVDRIWVDILKEETLSEQHFEAKNPGYWLGKEGKRIIITRYNQKLHSRIKIGDQYFSLKSYIYGLANELGNLIDISIKNDVIPDYI